MTLTVAIGNGSWYPAAAGSAPVITIPTSLPSGTVNTAYTSTQFYASGTDPITWSNTGALPAGMTFSSSGLLSGTPTATANSSITFTATNSYGANSTSLVLTVNSATNSAPVITSYVLLSGVAGSAYSDTITATGGNITWSIVNGSISPLSLNSSTGQITGTPSAAGNLTATFRATNANGTADKQFTINVIASGSGASPFVVGFVSTQNVYSGYPAGYTLRSYSNAAGPHVYEWSVNSGSLPSWLNFIQRGGDGEQLVAGTDKAGSSGGQLWGVAPANTTSSTALTFNLTNTISPNATTPTLTLNVVAPPNTAPTILTTTLPAAKVGVAYSNQLYAVGVPASFTWTLTSGNKPAWLTISSSGLMTGTPAAGDVTSGLIFTFTCTNGIGTATSQNLGFEVKSSSAKSLISPSDFTYVGYYDTSFDGLGANYVQGLAVRRVGSEVRLIQKTLDSNRFIEFSLSGKTPATSGSPSSCQINTTTREWSNSGGVNLGTEAPFLFWDSAGSRLLLNYAINYPGGPIDENTNIYSMTLTDGSPVGSVTNVKRLMLDGVGNRKAGTGITSIPSSYQSSYGWGSFAVGFGGIFSLETGYGGVSCGFALYGMPDPSSYSNNTTLTTSQYQVLASRGQTPRGRSSAIVQNFVQENGFLQSANGPDGMSWWTYQSRYCGGFFIDGSSKQGVVSILVNSVGRAWYEVSTVWSEGLRWEAHIFDPADLYRVSQGTQSPSVDPVYQNIRQLSETYYYYGSTYYNGRFGVIPSSIAYDDVAKRMYILVQGGNPNNANSNRVFVYDVNA